MNRYDEICINYLLSVSCSIPLRSHRRVLSPDPRQARCQDLLHSFIYEAAGQANSRSLSGDAGKACSPSYFPAVPHVDPLQTGWSRPGQLGPTVAQLAKQKKLLGLGGLKKLPRVFPADELVNRAVNRALSHKEDTTVKNQRQRARKYSAEQLAILSKELTKPTGEILEGYEKILKNLSPFEKVCCTRAGVCWSCSVSYRSWQI